MRKNASISTMVTTVLCFLVTVGVFMPITAAAKPTTLTYSNFFPPTHIQSQLAEQWGQEVEKRTEGRVKIQYFAGGTLTPAPSDL
jgi:TRAP-type transport system periplasmic protein